MIELQHDNLVFSFPEVHREARFTLGFQRTLRIPDDNREYPLPAGLGHFPVQHVDDFTNNLPETWLRHGGVMLPMYQSEAMWINFGSSDYPFAVKIAAGKINAVTGDAWDNGLHASPQDYVVLPNQPWLDGFCVRKGTIRQFVAMPLGEGYTAEEQLIGKAEHGGLQIIAYPMKRDAYIAWKESQMQNTCMLADMTCEDIGPGMGLAPGGLMRQEIFDDPHGIDVWDTTSSSRCFVHIANSVVYRRITGQQPPTEPITAKQYQARGVPWFEYYGGDLAALDGSKKLAGMDSVAAKTIKNGGLVDEPAIQIAPGQGKTLTAENVVREGDF